MILKVACPMHQAFLFNVQFHNFPKNFKFIGKMLIGIDSTENHYCAKDIMVFSQTS